ncbi:MAG: multicopper oxidase domain-containing protein [Caldilineaceae bacterium]
MNKDIQISTRFKMGTRGVLAVAMVMVGIIFALGSVRPALAASVSGISCTPSCDLYATTGTLTLADGVTVPIWGYSTTNTAGSATLPGPVLVVNQGDPVVINLHNIDVPNATSLSISQQNMVPDVAGVTAGNSATYSFAANQLRPGTFLYEAGLTANGPRQAAMGLFGAMIVRPAGAPTQAYADASTAFNDEAVLVLSEIDPAFNNAPAAYDLSYFAPKYWLINGKSYPNSDAISAAGVNASTPDVVLLRYVNAGLVHHSMGVLGQHQTVIAVDGQPATHQESLVADTVPTGTSLDTLITLPAGMAAGTKFALLDLAMHADNKGILTTPGNVNSPIAFGGMLTFVTVPGTTAGGAGPVTSAVSLSPNPSNGSAPVTLTAAIAPAPDAAEYFVDAIGTDGTGCSIAPAASVSISIPTSGAAAPCVDLATLTSANHTFYVHGHDANGWGVVASAVLNLDKLGPIISNMSLTPSITNGSGPVQLVASGSDVTTGNQNVTAAEYTIDGGPATTISIATPATVVNLNAAITPPATEGSHTVAVRAQDALGNWGAFANIALVVDKTGPTASAVSVQPNPNNGAQGVQVGTGGGFYLRIDGSVTDPTSSGVNSNIAGAEYYIDMDPGAGHGGAMFSTSGAFNSVTQSVYGAVDLYILNQLGDGNHTVCVRGKDVAGNWGACNTTTLLIDKTAPTFASITLAPNPTVAAAAAATMSPPATVNIAGGEFFVDTVGAAVWQWDRHDRWRRRSGLPPSTGPLPRHSRCTSAQPHGSRAGQDAAGNRAPPPQPSCSSIAPTFSITLNPNSIPVGTASVNLTVNGAKRITRRC